MDILGPADVLTSPLPVTRLAVGAVKRAGEAVERYAAASGRPVALSTDTRWVAASFASNTRLSMDGRAPGAMFAPLSGFFATKTDPVRTHANYPHHAQRLRAALRLAPDAGSDAVTLAFAATDAERIASRVTALGGICVPVGRPETWSEHPAYGRPAGPEGRRLLSEPCRPNRGTEAVRPEAVPPTAATSNDCDADGAAWLPLSGLRVLSLTRVIAGPIASRFMAALGADVIRIDPPALPELLDQHVDTDFGVRVHALDLRNAADLQGLHALLETADALITGYRPGAISAFGLDDMDLRERFPRLAVAGLQAWDPDGSWAHRRGFDSIVQAASGISRICGQHCGLGALPVQALDHATGFRAVAGVLDMMVHGGGIARFALADAAADLMGLIDGDCARASASPADGPLGGTLPDPGPETFNADSAYGRLNYVPPPIAVAGARLDYPTTPKPAETSLPRWRDT